MAKKKSRYQQKYAHMRRLGYDPARARRAAKDGCYVATSVYGSYDCPEVWVLRRFRDDTLSNSVLGRMFIKSYYAVSPTLVKWFGSQKWFNRFFKAKLDYFVISLKLKGYSDKPYQGK